MLDLNSPIKSAVIIYLFLMFSLVIYKPDLLTDNRRSQSLFSVAVVIVSIISYYLLTIIKYILGR
jgi:hypothetical protein